MISDADVQRFVERLAEPNPTIGREQPSDWHVWGSKRDATAKLMDAGYSREKIAEMVSTVCEARLAEHRRKRATAAR